MKETKILCGQVNCSVNLLIFRLQALVYLRARLTEELSCDMSTENLRFFQCITPTGKENHIEVVVSAGHADVHSEDNKAEPPFILHAKK